MVTGVEAHGVLLGPRAALSLGVGFTLVRKSPQPNDAEDPLLTRTTPSDYKNRGLNLSVRASPLRWQDRVVLVDDWVHAGAQATAVQAFAADAGAT